MITLTKMFLRKNFVKRRVDIDIVQMNIEKREGERYCSSKEEYRINFFYGFLDYIKKHNSTIDFFSLTRIIL